MEKIDLKTHLYHGIVDWRFYAMKLDRREFCLDKLESILKSRYISRPCDFEEFGVNHNDYFGAKSSDYTNNDNQYYTYVAFHPDSIFASRFHNREKSCYLIATEDSRFGIILSPRLIDELPIEEESFDDSEVVIADNISLDQYGVGIYINPIFANEDDFQRIKAMINQNQYPFPIINIQNGEVVESIEKGKIKSLSSYTETGN